MPQHQLLKKSKHKQQQHLKLDLSKVPKVSVKKRRGLRRKKVEGLQRAVEVQTKLRIEQEAVRKANGRGPPVRSVKLYPTPAPPAPSSKK